MAFDVNASSSVWPSAGARTTASVRKIGGGARPVLDHERLAEPLRQPLTDHARRDVGAAGRRKTDDEAHWPRRIGLCASAAGKGRKRGCPNASCRN